MSNELQLLEFDYQGTKLSCPLQQGMRMIPVRPVCELLGVDFSNQNKWLKSHTFYKHIYLEVKAVGVDQKAYTMRCLSIIDMFGWINHIGTNNRDENSITRQNHLLLWLRELHVKRYTENQVISERDKEELAIREKLEQLEEKEAELNASKQELKKEKAMYKERLDQIIFDKRNGQISMKLD